MEAEALVFSTPELGNAATEILPSPSTESRGVILESDDDMDDIPDEDFFQEELNIRRIFTPRPGKLFVRCDYAQLEVRIVAHYSGDKDLIDAILQGGDMHSIIAHKVFKLNCEISEVKKKYKKYRSAAKAIVFGLIYGITAVGLGAGLNISTAEAQEYIDAFFATYPGLLKFLKTVEEFAVYSKFVYNAMGRKRRFMYVNNRALRQGKNFPVQSTASDITTNAMVLIDQRIIEENLQDYMQILMQIHDEILTETDIARVAYCKQLMKECMEPGLARFGIQFAVPLLTDPSVDYAWGYPLSTGDFEKPGAREDEFTKLCHLREVFNGSDQHAVDAACHDYYLMFFRELSNQRFAGAQYDTLPGNKINILDNYSDAIGLPTHPDQPFWFRRTELQYLNQKFLADPDYDIYRSIFPPTTI